MAKKAKCGKSSGCKGPSIQPLADRVVILPMDAEEVTAGGIVLPDTAQEKPLKGTVIAVGPGTLMDNGQRATLSVKHGDQVIYGKYAGSDIEEEGITYLVMRENDILAIVED